MVSIIPARLEDLIHVQTIAQRTWPTTFAEILSPEQIKYMLNLLYDFPHLQKQIEQGHIFLLADENGEKLGFTGIEVNNEPFKTKIHKIYILPSAQGRGIGKKLFQAIKEIAFANNQTSLQLNVNKYNQGAIDFYEYLGFVNIKSEIIDIGNGYVMDDYVFELKL
ncbi:ribosomal protein S18 acetylase RimI-like enzyme [Algoriphagus ratkowskyi]|uniref:GNAT family N-acetyltransferase n=1 Tax=Algoriphagus ratkowskyi TaxID=57028 RepID=A0A2W7RGP7_9BACT|nr:GNAT family N-acetyltransferase [Algoriphagus ratkowskyi]PZX59574.1 ribosomal protein S18 acetylase RimI-like enzyme [Algoriphagus ratkowskyi]TXD78701.1 GNAT family N-acetyltransferase [Algoriphagus ratkowskyi]